MKNPEQTSHSAKERLVFSIFQGTCVKFSGEFSVILVGRWFCGHCLSPDGSNGVQVKQNAVLGCLGVGSAGSLSHLSNECVDPH